MGEFNQIEYNNKYNKEHYARLGVLIPIEDKEKINNHWKKKGYKSFSAYANDLIRKDMFESSDKATKIVHVDTNDTININ